MIFKEGVRLVCYGCQRAFWYNGDAIYNIICPSCKTTLNIEKLRKMGCEV